jgi:translation initiation factor 2D
MATLVNPFLPAYTSHEASQLQIKKTSWKNIKKFIKHFDKQRIVKSKDQHGNETVILGIDFEHRTILSFTPYRLPKKEPPTASAPDAQAETGGDPSVGQTLTLISLHKPKPALSELFSAAKFEQKTFYTALEIKSAITAYIEYHELIAPTNKRVIKLDPFLANTVIDGSQGAADKEVIARGTISREKLPERVLASCAPFHVITRNNDSASTLKPKAGGPPKIVVTMETRSGNKTVTKIMGLEAYYVLPQPLADELRKTCAGSTSVERYAGSSPKAPVMEIMVQGPQAVAVLKALEKRGVDRRWVDVVDKTKGKKKG